MTKILKVGFWGIIAIIVGKIATNIFYYVFPPDILKGVDHTHALLAALVGIISALPFLIKLVKSNPKASLKKTSKS